MSKTMALRPRLSEKAYALTTKDNTYVFGVPMTANKMTVADSVADQFGVVVEDVHIIVVKGKKKQSYRKGRRPVAGKRADTKKAYVRLKDGDSINIFGDEDKKDDKSDKKQDKSAETKTSAKTEVKQKRGLRQALSGRTQRQTQDRGGSK